MNSKIKDNIREAYEDLMNNESTTFELTENIYQDPDLKFSIKAQRDEKEQYNENQYSIDVVINIEIGDENRWNEVDSEIKTVGDQIRQINMNKIGLSAPIVFRSNSDPSVKNWARRIMHTED